MYYNECTKHSKDFNLSVTAEQLWFFTHLRSNPRPSTQTKTCSLKALWCVRWLCRLILKPYKIRYFHFIWQDPQRTREVPDNCSPRPPTFVCGFAEKTSPRSLILSGPGNPGRGPIPLLTFGSQVGLLICVSISNVFGFWSVGGICKYSQKDTHWERVAVFPSAKYYLEPRNTFSISPCMNYKWFNKRQSQLIKWKKKPHSYASLIDNN